MHRRKFVSGSACLAAAALANGKAFAAPPSDGGVAAFAASRSLVQTRFGRIACVQRGRGPAALFLHAWPLNSYEWRGVLEPLSAARRCIAPDAMGLGYTEVADGQELSPGTQADMLADLLTTLGERQADVVANDSGGLVAQMFAARHPERVRSLLLTNCDVGKDNPPPSFVPIVQAAKAGVLADPGFRRMLADVSIARSPRGLGSAYAHPDQLSQSAVEYYLSPLVSTASRRDQLHRYTASLGHNDLLDVQPALAKVQAPVRIVWGADDTVFDPASPEILDRTFPKSRGVRRVPGARTFFPEEMPEIIVEEARTLWASQSGL